MKHDDAHAYSAYGYAATLPPNLTILGFNGEHRQDVEHLYILGAGERAYSVSLMRFMSVDNLSPFSKGGINAYSYCSGDPVNRVDRTGHFFTWIRRKFSSRPKYATISKIRNAGETSKLIATNYERDTFIRQKLESYGYDKLSNTNLNIVKKALHNISKEIDTQWNTPNAITQKIDSFQFIANHKSLVRHAFAYTDRSNKATYNLESIQSSLVTRMNEYQNRADLKLSTGLMEFARNIRRDSI